MNVNVNANTKRLILRALDYAVFNFILLSIMAYNTKYKIPIVLIFIIGMAFLEIFNRHLRFSVIREIIHFEEINAYVDFGRMLLRASVKYIPLIIVAIFNHPIGNPISEYTIISFILINIICLISTEGNLSLHDILCKTYVAEKPSYFAKKKYTDKPKPKKKEMRKKFDTKKALRLLANEDMNKDGDCFTYEEIKTKKKKSKKKRKATKNKTN